MGDKRDTYVIAWTSAQERELLQKGWTHVGGVYLFGSTEHPVMAPPEPVPPTLAERMRKKADAGSFTWPVVRELLHEAADALERAERIEAAAAKAVDRNLILVSPPDIPDYYPIAAENVNALRNALEAQ